VRRRSGTLKAKALLDRADDGFELWETRINGPIPASVDVWRDALALLGAEGEATTLAASPTADHVCALLGQGATGLTGVELVKDRVFYRLGPAQLEVTEVSAGGQVLQSVAFESPDLGAARDIRRLVAADALGRPENYVSLCQRLAEAR
jgi:hypothetical protein